ncbi:MAG TPA: CCA tRNA nucleotidyltransferase [Thermoplasmata archaeon]|nr:CCA tRNA nucleotidyltransferase [Thermoplasmata archaeon]
MHSPHRPAAANPVADQLEARVSDRVSPTREMQERVARVRTELVDRVRAAAEKRSSPLVRALVAGSAARGTYLSDRLDIDLFLLFPPDLTRDRLREEGLALGRAVLTEPETRYAEHPYLRGHFEGFNVDAVPGFAITDPSRPLSPVDRTPFHQEYLSARETPPLVAQVRLAKQFFRSLGVYGSESRTEGFSGYLVELLVLRFGSLQGLLGAARSWRVPVRIEEPGRDPPRLPAEVALILADPVDPHRNVASALSRRNLALLILAAGAYLDRPADRWFEVRAPRPFPRDEAIARVHERGTHVAIVSLPRPDLVDDTLYPQVRKAERAIAEEVARSGFELVGSASAVEPARVVVAVEVGHAHRPAVRAQDGPPAGLDRVGQFLDKWTAPDAPVLQGPYVRPDGSLGVDTRRADREVEPVIRAVLPRLSLGRDLTPTDPGQVAVRPLAAESDSPALSEALRELVGRRLPWLDLA